MIEWFLTLNLFEQILYTLAIVSSSTLIIKGVLSMLGMTLRTNASDKKTKVHTSDNSARFRFFSFQSALLFVTVVTWGTVIAYSMGAIPLLAIAVGIIAGSVMSFSFAKIIRIFGRQTANNDSTPDNIVGRTVEVIQTIPPKDLGEGTVSININGSKNEYAAVSNERHSLSCGTLVRIVDIINDTIIVEKYHA